MNADQLKAVLSTLGLTQVEGAQLLGVSDRTFRRWVERPDEIPGPAEQALLAWERLNNYGLPWRHDAVVLGVNDPRKIAESMAAYRDETIQLVKVLQRVRKRGGPASPWQVDLDAQRATLGPMRVSFYRLHNGGFSPSGYSRRDRDPDLKRDAALLEDAWYCIAEAIAAQRPKKPARK